MTESDILDLAKTEDRFPDQWLLFEVLEADAQGRPVRGRLICHHRDREYVEERDLAAQLPHTYLTYSGPVLPEGVEAALAGGIESARIAGTGRRAPFQYPA